MEGKDDTAAIIILVTLSIFVIVCIAVIVRVAINRSKKNLQDVQNIAKRREEEMKSKSHVETEAAQQTDQGLMASADKMMEMRGSTLELTVAQTRAKKAEVEKYEE